MATETLAPASRRPIFDLLRRDRRAQLALPLLVLLALAAAARPLMSQRMRTTDTDQLLAGPSAQHLLGTDELGRDVLARIISGALVTVEVATITVGVALIVGTALGLLAGYRGGWLDAVIMRISDGLLAFPLLVLALTVVAALGPGLRNALIAIAVVTTPRFARVVRGDVLSLRTREWVSAAHIVGVSQVAIMRRHLLPHLAGTLLVFAALQVSTAIMAEAALSFLGLSVQPPQPSWGAMVASGTDHLSASWSLSVFPGLAILFTVAAFNLLADALRDALDAHRPQLTPPR
ncbi:ABC transporter permease [Streptomyces sp. NBC_00687]|uniref:ABC transporter permease n=1 Tax=Streptomyces sp. NBC_00687 TaxID=2975807 RepID=UPI0022534E36|nr:ABC transporter permease [Streptomyces sp. NBC_00687]MCX4918908.1 ABC transporter permease [Streptomyces sp. NBC_00687]